MIARREALASDQHRLGFEEAHLTLGDAQPKIDGPGRRRTVVVMWSVPSLVSLCTLVTHELQVRVVQRLKHRGRLEGPEQAYGIDLAGLQGVQRIDVAQRHELRN